MEDVKVIVYGVGSIGSGVVRTLQARKGVKVVGVIDIDPEKVGKDAGVVAGCDPIGVTVVATPDELIGKVEADVVLETANPLGIRETYERIKWALENKMNVIVACMETCNLWFTDAELAQEIDDCCKANGVSYIGLGATQTEERYVMQMTEGSTDVEYISFTHHADCQAFSDSSNAEEWGLSLTEEEYYKRVAEGTTKSKEDLKSIVPYMANKLGWELSDVTLTKTLGTDENGKINSLLATVEGYVDGVPRLAMNWEMVTEPERRYFDHLIVKGVPQIDAMNNYSPDRGMAATIGSITNGCAIVRSLPVGYVNTLSAQINSIVFDEYYNH